MVGIRQVKAARTPDPVLREIDVLKFLIADAALRIEKIRRSRAAPAYERSLTLAQEAADLTLDYLMDVKR